MTAHAVQMTIENPRGFDVPGALLEEFERGLDTLRLGRSTIPCHVLGFGEISTVFEIQSSGLEGLAFKRMCVFRTLDELSRYVATFLEYNRRLEKEIGLHLPSSGYAYFVCASGRPVFYIIQKKLAPGSIGNNALRALPATETMRLFGAILSELHKVWDYNRGHADARVGIDGQISNWAIEGFDARQRALPEKVDLQYIDTSTPICFQGGVEQLDPELFLRSAPPYLVWILRLLFVKDVMTRYYDARKVMVDLMANFYKEQRPELVPDLVRCANEFIAGEGARSGLAPIRLEEVEGYYREDMLIWTLYLAMRRFDRFVRARVLHRPYPYILPGKIKR